MIEKGQVSLVDGTLVRHRVKGYEGRIEGITEIKACFTRSGVSLPISAASERFQYRVVVVGELLRRIAPMADLQIVEETMEIVCWNCNRVFRNKPGLVGKPAGRCDCGALICPSCLRCQVEESDTAKVPASSCLSGRKRLGRRHAVLSKAKTSTRRRT